MTPEEIKSALEQHLLQVVEEVDPATTSLVDGYLIVSDRVIIPLDGVSWSLDRSEDIQVLDELGATLGVLCLVSKRPSQKISEMTRWQYSSYLSDCTLDAVANDQHHFSKDYFIIERSDLVRYKNHYSDGSSLWGDFHHGGAPTGHIGWRRHIVARPNISSPTQHHNELMMLISHAVAPQEQYLKIYHVIELLFDYITFRKIVKVGNDLAGFGRVLAGHQRMELDRLKSIMREYCGDLNAVAQNMTKIIPYLDRAEQMFQVHTKDGNPLNTDEKWEKFIKVVQSGSVNSDTAKYENLAGSTKAFDDMFVSLAAYQIYRIRSSIAHSRIGEYVLSSADDEFVARFGVPMIQEVAIQILSNNSFKALMT